MNSQKQKGEVFKSLWNYDMDHRITDFEIEIENYKTKSNHKIVDWLETSFSNKTRVLDAGCGLGGGLCNILRLLRVPYKTDKIFLPWDKSYSIVKHKTIFR